MELLSENLLCQKELVPITTLTSKTIGFFFCRLAFHSETLFLQKIYEGMPCEYFKTIISFKILERKVEVSR